MLGQIAREVTYWDRLTFVRLYKIFVIPHLNYAVQAWAPYNQADKDILVEKVQKRALVDTIG